MTFSGRIFGGIYDANDLQIKSTMWVRSLDLRCGYAVESAA